MAVVTTPAWCPHCFRDLFGLNACQCPGSGLLAGTGGTLNLGLVRDPLPRQTNDVQFFAEEFMAHMRYTRTEETPMPEHMPIIIRGEQPPDPADLPESPGGYLFIPDAISFPVPGDSEDEFLERLYDAMAAPLRDRPLTVGERANAWRRRRSLSTDPGWITAKLLEEAGELARAVIGRFEEREGRGDPVQEAAQTVIVIASLLDAVAPGTDLYAAVETELDRLGAPRP